MSANFRLTLPLLERLDDEAVIAWGRAFDWSIPEVDVSTYAGDRQRPGRRLGQPVQPARALLAHGSERLKNLLLRSDMFGNGEPFICEGDIWRSTDRPLDTHHHLWADLWTAAWALGDAASVDRMWTWVPPGVKHLAMFSDRAHFLNDFGRYGKPEHVPEMLKRLKKLIGEDPLSSLSFRGRIKTRERKALVRSMTQAVQVAIRTGNLAWVESVENILPEAVHCPEVVAEAFGSAHFALGRRLFEALPRPPALGEATPHETFSRHAPSSWADCLVQGWRMFSWLKRDEEQTDDERAVREAQWLVHGLNRDGSTAHMMRKRLHQAALGHNAQWGRGWVEWLKAEGMNPSEADIETLAKGGASDEVAAQWLASLPSDAWRHGLRACCSSASGKREPLQRAARWGGRFSGQNFPKEAVEWAGPQLLDEARRCWAEGRALALAEQLPEGRHRRATRL